VTVQFTQDAPVGYTATATPDVTNVLVVGPESLVQQVESVQARLSLQNQRASLSRSVVLSPVDANNKVINGVTLTPSEVMLNVEIQQRADVTELSVDPRLIGELPAGYLRRNYNWNPTRIIVRGDQAAIDRMGGVAPTEPIDLTGRTQTFTQTVKLALPSGVVMPDPTDITVTIEVEPVLVSHEFTDIPVQTQGLDPADFQITVRPEKVSVIVTGPQTAIDGLTSSDISVFAPLSGLAAGTHTVTLQPSVTKADIAGQNVTIPNNQAEVTIIARHPTITPTQGPTRTPTVTPTPVETVTATPAQ
jgi:YbbR domain-containing protein